MLPGQPFSLLMSTYAGDRPEFLREAFVSTVVDQTRPPAQVVLVQDGPVGEELGAEIERLKAESPVGGDPRGDAGEPRPRPRARRRPAGQ